MILPPGDLGARTNAQSLAEVLEMLLEHGEPELDSAFMEVQTFAVA